MLDCIYIQCKELNMTQKQITDMLYNGLSYEWLEDNYDRDHRTYDLELFFDNLDGVCIEDEQQPGYMNFKDYLEVNELTENKFFDKWLSIIRETKEGQKYINKVLDYQNNDAGEYVGFKQAKKYTDDEIKEFFRNCWYS